jgi:hypothetical protein
MEVCVCVCVCVCVRAPSSMAVPCVLNVPFPLDIFLCQIPSSVLIWDVLLVLFFYGIKGKVLFPEKGFL